MSLKLLPVHRRSRRALGIAFLILLCPALAAATPCELPNTGGGTVNLPPPSPPCPYTSPTDFHMIVDGLPAGTQINVGVEHSRFVNVVRDTSPVFPGGQKENFSSTLVLTLTGQGFPFNRTIVLNGVQCETHVAAHTPGAVVQSFDTQMQGLQGQLPPGDPDFDLLRITAGNGFGLPSPGHTTLTLLSNGNWNVDSFFDITYRIDFIGHPGSILGGHSGSTTGTIRMGTGQPAPTPPGPCVVAGNGAGTVDLPPAGCGYVSPDDLHQMINGLPPGTTITVGVQHQDFFNVTHSPDPLGGEVEQFQSGLLLKLNGTGDLAGYTRNLFMQAQCQAHTGPRTPGQNIQSFDTEMLGIQGQLPPGDPDFDLLRITAGSGFGMPSPGHTTLTRRPPGLTGWNVDSFFDITYRIDFVGHPGGPLGGMSGSTTGTIRMATGQPTLVSVPGQPPAKIDLVSSPNPMKMAGSMVQYRLPSSARVDLSVFDASGKKVRVLTNEMVPAGPHAMLWDARDDQGRKLGSGTYFIRLMVDGKTMGSQKATIVK